MSHISNIPVFLSVGEPHLEKQEKYLAELIKYLEEEGISAETLGRTFWSVKNPLRPVQQKMQEMYGIVVLAMERFQSAQGVYKKNSELEKQVSEQFYPSVWTQIEAAMAYQLDLPILILKQNELISEGMFDSSIHEWTVVRININSPDELNCRPIKGYIDSWLNEVRKLYYQNN